MAEETKQNYVPVYVDRFKGDDAYCRAIYKDRYLPVTLNRQSLENINIAEGDCFEWIPRKDGIVRLEDIKKGTHPRILTPEEVQEAKQTAENLQKNWSPEEW